MRLRKAPAQDPEIRRQLDGADALLAGDPSAELDAELAALLRAVAAERPAPREEFVRALDARAAQGFRAAPGSHAPRATRSWLRPGLRPLPLAAGTAAAAFIVAVAIVSSGGRDDSGGGSRG